ncbi:MAG TPA: RNA methyltransferase [Bacteroidota bacterium]|nr:RNA methyltransferase [Bacteroidota bacterium]
MIRPRRISQSTLRQLAKLNHKKYRRAQRRFLIEGFHLVEEALESDWQIEMILMTPTALSKDIGRRLIEQAEKKNVEVAGISEPEARKLSDTVTSQGILAVVQVKEYAIESFWSSPNRRSLVVALDGISDPGNLGTILRTCDWFGVDAVWLDPASVELYSPKVVRSTMGSIFHLPVLPDVDLIMMLRLAKKNGWKVMVTAPTDGSPIPRDAYAERSVIVFGNEAHGVGADIQREADQRISVPRFGAAESLNVAVACGVIVGAIRLSKGV